MDYNLEINLTLSTDFTYKKICM